LIIGLATVLATGFATVFYGTVLAVTGLL